MVKTHNTKLRKDITKPVSSKDLLQEKGLKSLLDLFYRDICETAPIVLSTIQQLLPEELANRFTRTNVIWLHAFSFANGRSNLRHSCSIEGVQRIIDLGVNLLQLDKEQPLARSRLPLHIDDIDLGYEARNSYSNVPNLVRKRIIEIYKQERDYYNGRLNEVPPAEREPFDNTMILYNHLFRRPLDYLPTEDPNPFLCQHGNSFLIQCFETTVEEAIKEKAEDLVEKYEKEAQYYENCADDCHATDAYKLRMLNSAKSCRFKAEEAQIRRSYPRPTGKIIEKNGFYYGPCACYSTPARWNRKYDAGARVDRDGNVIVEDEDLDFNPFAGKRPLVPSPSKNKKLEIKTNEKLEAVKNFDFDDLQERRKQFILDRNKRLNEAAEKEKAERKARQEENDRNTVYIKARVPKIEQEQHKEQNQRDSLYIESRSPDYYDQRNEHRSGLISPSESRRNRDYRLDPDSSCSSQSDRYNGRHYRSDRDRYPSSLSRRERARDRSTSRTYAHGLTDPRIDQAWRLFNRGHDDELQRPWMRYHRSSTDMYRNGVRAFNWNGNVPLRPYLNGEHFYSVWTLSGRDFKEGNYAFSRSNPRFTNDTRKQEQLTEIVSQGLYLLEQLDPKLTRQFINAQNYRYFAYDARSPNAGPHPDLQEEFGPAEQAWYREVNNGNAQAQQDQYSNNMQEERKEEDEEIIESLDEDIEMQMQEDVDQTSKGNQTDIQKM